MTWPRKWHILMQLYPEQRHDTQSKREEIMQSGALNEKQKRILEYIRNQIEDVKGPTLQEFADSHGFSLSDSVRDVLKKLSGGKTSGGSRSKEKAGSISR